MKLIALLAGLAFAAVQHAVAGDGWAFDSRNFSLNVSQMLPASYPSKLLSYGYSVTVRNDSAFVHLPYMGRVYRPVLDGDGLHFRLPVEDYKVSEMRKGGLRIEFTVRDRSVRYDFILKVFLGGNADVFLRPDNAQSISYMADVNDEKQPDSDGQ